MARKFPRVIYVKWVGENEPYLVAEEALKDLTGQKPCRIAAYSLTEEYDLRGVAEVRRKGTKQWIR